MKKPVFAMLLGGFLGIFDGLSALLSAPQEAPNIVGIVIGSTFKGVIAGLIIGLVAQPYGEQSSVRRAGNKFLVGPLRGVNAADSCHVMLLSVLGCS